MCDYRQDFYDAYTVAIGAPAVADRGMYESVRPLFAARWKKYLPSNRDAVFLDLACGSGEYLYFLKSLGYSRTVGVDLCRSELDLARDVGITELLCTDAISYLQKESRQFDVISAFIFFEHLQKSEVLTLLRLIQRALKPGGILIAVTPNGISPFSGSTRYWDFSHESAYTPASWRQLARITGFQSATFEDYGPSCRTMIGVLRLAMWQVVKSLFDVISLIEVARPRDVSRVYTADMKIILRKAGS